MAITLVGTASGTGSGSATVTLPAGTAQDDVVYAAVVAGGVDQVTSENSGTYAKLADLHGNDNDDVNFGLFRKVQGATPDTSVTLVANSGLLNAAVAIVLRGVDTTTPEDATTTTATGVNGGTPDPPAITTVTNGAWVLAFGGSTELDDVVNPPTNYSNLIDVINGRNVMAATREIATAGAEDPSTFADVVGTIADSWAAATVAVRPAAAAGGTTPSLALLGVGA